MSQEHHAFGRGADTKSVQELFPKRFNLICRKSNTAKPFEQSCYGRLCRMPTLRTRTSGRQIPHLPTNARMAVGSNYAPHNRPELFP